MVEKFLVILIFACGVSVAQAMDLNATPNPSEETDFSPNNDPQVCAMDAGIQGLDVYQYNDVTNWSTVLQTGHSYAVVKATEGISIVDTLFQYRWTTIANTGIVRGAYHFFHPADDPIQQAKFFLSEVGPLGPNDLPPVLDWEATDTGVPVATQIARALTWLNYVEQQTGRRPIIYTFPAFIDALGNPAGLDRYPLWISNTGMNCPLVPAPWKNWTFWQYSAQPIAGSTGPVDLDVFNGSADQLKAFIKSGQHP